MELEAFSDFSHLGQFQTGSPAQPRNAAVTSPGRREFSEHGLQLSLG